MQKTFQSLEDLLEFDFSNLEPQKSNYLRLIPNDGVLPTVNKKFHPKRWIATTHQEESASQITFEITPLWVTITIHESKESRKEDFEALGKDAKSIITEVFEPEDSE